MTKFISTSKIHSNQSININERGKVGIENSKDPTTFINYSQKIYLYENLEDYNPTKKRRVLIVFDDIIADMESNKKLSPKVTKLFLRGKELNISLVFISQSYFKVPKTKCSTLYYDENSKQKRTLTNSFKSFV